MRVVKQSLVNVGAILVGALPSSVDVQVHMDARGELSELTEDNTREISAMANDVKVLVANDLGMRPSLIDVQTLAAHLPPPRPPSLPPPPSVPPPPPSVPPGSPAAPPPSPEIPPGQWFTRYTEDCDPECYGGCFSSLWSEIYTWHGQGIALVSPREAAEEPLASWRSPDEPVVSP